MSQILETTLEVLGMNCRSCVGHVDVALREIDGVHSVDVRFRDGKVVVAHDPLSAPVQSLVEALAQAGYEAKPSA